MAELLRYQAVTSSSCLACVRSCGRAGLNREKFTFELTLWETVMQIGFAACCIAESNSTMDKKEPHFTRGVLFE
ncbi:MAG: hypothetical protein CMF59_14325 [Leptospiraceae bacterium]|nr:hypothetical protein [Leptospiraceae bacterium]